MILLVLSLIPGILWIFTNKAHDALEKLYYEHLLMFQIFVALPILILLAIILGVAFIPFNIYRLLTKKA